MNQPDSLTATAAPAPGERLRQAREAHNLTREDVAARLRLSAAKIEALERGDVAGSVAPVFLAGYLRAYARLVGLAPEEIIGEFESLTEMAAPSIDPSAVTSANGHGTFRAELPAGFSLAGGKTWRAAWRWSLVGLVLIAVAGAWWQIREGKQEAPASVAGILDVPPVAAMTEAVASRQAEIVEAAAEAPAVPGEAPAPREPLAPRVQLALTLVDESWVEIVDAQGNRLMHELARAGQTHTLTGVAPFEVMLGFVAGVQMEYNGAPYDLSRFQKRRTAKFTVGAAGDRMNTD